MTRYFRLIVSIELISEPTQVRAQEVLAHIYELSKTKVVFDELDKFAGYFRFYCILEGYETAFAERDRLNAVKSQPNGPTCYFLAYVEGI